MKKSTRRSPTSTSAAAAAAAGAIKPTFAGERPAPDEPSQLPLPGFQSNAGSRSSTPNSKLAMDDIASYYLNGTASPAAGTVAGAAPFAHGTKHGAHQAILTVQDSSGLLSMERLTSQLNSLPLGVSPLPSAVDINSNNNGNNNKTAAEVPDSSPPSLSMVRKNPPELQRLSNNLDKWTGLMKNAILSDFLAMLQEHTGDLHQIRNMHQDDVNKLRTDLANTVGALNKSKVSLDRKERLVEDLVLKNIFGPKKSMVKRYFNVWHLKCLKASSITSSRFVFSNHIARTHYKKTLVRKVMNAWIHDVMQMSWKKRLQRQAKTDFNEELANVRKEYEEKIEKLQATNGTLDSQLGSVLNERARYAEEMKQALLRGVCALNIETMSVFGQQGQGNENLPEFGKPSHHSVDQLPFAPQDDERLRPSPLKSNIPPLKESTWVNQQGRSYSPERYSGERHGVAQPTGRYPAAGPTVLPHRHVSDYAALHQPPPPVPSLFRRQNPGSLHVANQHPVSTEYTPQQQMEHQQMEQQQAPPVSAPRARSPDHSSTLHNFKAIPRSGTGSGAPSHGGRVIRPAVEQAQRGPIGMLTLRDDKKSAAAAGGGRSLPMKGIRVERHAK